MLKRHLIQQVYFLKAFLPNPSGHDIAETPFSSPLHSKTSKESSFRSDITSRPDGPTKHRGSNIMVATYNTLKTGKYRSMKNNNR
jgi:hypothetical protein